MRSSASGARRPVASTPCPSRTMRVSRCTSRSATPPSAVASATSRRIEFVPQSIAATRDMRAPPPAGRLSAATVRAVRPDATVGPRQQPRPNRRRAATLCAWSNVRTAVSSTGPVRRRPPVWSRGPRATDESPIPEQPRASGPHRGHAAAAAAAAGSRTSTRTASPTRPRRWTATTRWPAIPRWPTPSSGRVRRAPCRTCASSPRSSARPRRASMPGSPTPIRPCCARTTATATASTRSSTTRPGTGWWARRVGCGPARHTLGGRARLRRARGAGRGFYLMSQLESGHAARSR